MAREPERSCLGCRQRAPKTELLRIARTPGGVVRTDSGSSAPGRGAYVHPNAACVAAALRRNVLARALRTGLAQDELARLRIEIEEALQAR